ncbi:hypothetical protein ACHAW6_013639 [Cyclotella cf. meneghiniana]
MRYMLGKAEGTEELWHGNVSAGMVAPIYRRLGLERMLMEGTSANEDDDAYFVDLFMGASNALAISMYKKFGYVNTDKFRILFRR